MYRLTLLLVLIVLSAAAEPQDRGFFRQVWLEEGLSQSSITAITQDENGFLWFGTQDGLNRFDGKRVDQFNFQPFNNNSISGDHIQNLIAYDKKVWILSGAGLDNFDINTGIVNRLNKDKKIKSDEKSFNPYRIWKANSGIFLFSSQGIHELDPKSLNRTHHKIEKSDKDKKIFIHNICETSGKRYFATSDGVYSSDLKEKTIRQVQDLKGMAPAFSVIPLQDKLCFSVREMIYVYDPSSGKTISFSCGNNAAAHVTSLLADNRGFLWAGTNGNGLFRFSVNSNELIVDKHFLDEPGNRFSLRCNYISTLFQSDNPNEDIIWIGSRDAGAIRYSYAKNSFVLHSARLKESGVNFFGTVKDRKGIIYSGSNNGLYIFNPDKEPIFIDLSDPKGTMQRPVEALYCDENDVVWAGLDNDLYIIRDGKMQLIKTCIYPDAKANIMKIAAYHDSLLFIGSSHGYVLYDKKNNHVLPAPFELPKKDNRFASVGSVLRDSKNNLWIGTMAGLFRFKPDGSRIGFGNNDNKETSILADIIMDLAETRKGEILVGTTKGLSILIPDGEGYRIENHYKPDGLLNNFIYSIVPGKQGNFWLSTNFGLCSFNPELRTFRTFTALDGIFLNEFNSGGAYHANDGEILFGGIGGLIGFYPEKISRTRVRPGISLRSASVNGNLLTVPQNKKFSPLTYKENNIHLDFSVIDFSDDGKTRLLYKLNSESQWLIVNGSSSISLANLAPGTYTIYVKAANRDGLESAQPVVLTFTIDPPFWLTWWFYGVLLVLFVGAAWLIHRNNLKKKIRVIQERERIREEENEKLRKTAALDLHDEFGNGLTRISMLVELARLKGLQENEDAAKILNIISDNSARLYQGTKDYIWSINSGNDNLYEVIIRIKDFADELFYERNVNLVVTGLSEDLKTIRQVPGTGRNVAMIFKEALSNILKHADARTVTLSVTRESDTVKLCLKDDGKGFDMGRSGSGFGLGNMKQRASRVNAELNVVSAKGNGSEITLTLNEYK